MSPLYRIVSDTGNPNILTEVADAIRKRVAFLFICGADGCVLKPVVERAVPGVLVWIGWGQSGAPERHLAEVKLLARSIGARWLRFHSPRRGWLRVAPQMGWVRQPDDADGMLVFQMDL